MWEHEWVTEPNVLWKENDFLEALKYDLDAPVVTFTVLFTVKALSKICIDGTNVAAKYRETVNRVIEITFNVPSGCTRHGRAYCEQ